MRLASAQHARQRTSQSIESIEITSNSGEVISALQLVYDSYLRSGLIGPNPHRIRVTPFHLLPTSEVLIATRGRSVACTLTLVHDGKLGLPMESIFKEEVSHRREQGIATAEVTCLADRCASHRGSFPLLIKLMCFAIQCAALRGVEELMIAVHPRHARFYQSFWGASLINDVEQKYEVVQGHPAVALSLDIPKLWLSDSSAYRRIFSQQFPAEQFCRNPLPATLLTELTEIVGETYLPLNYQNDPQHQEQGKLDQRQSVA